MARANNGGGTAHGGGTDLAPLWSASNHREKQEIEAPHTAAANGMRPAAIVGVGWNELLGVTLGCM